MKKLYIWGTQKKAKERRIADAKLQLHNLHLRQSKLIVQVEEIKTLIKTLELMP